MSFEDLYELCLLPRIPDVELGEKCTVSSLGSPSDAYVDVGVSRSMVSSYVLKPTPKMVWSYTLPLSTIIECMDVLGDKDTGEKYFVGVTDRNSHFRVLCITKAHNESACVEISLKKKVKGIKATRCGNFVFVVFSDGEIRMLKLENGQLVDSEFSIMSLAKDGLAYYKFIRDDSFNKELLLTVELGDMGLVYRLFALDYEKTHTVRTVVSPLVENAIFAYMSGVVYQFDIDTMKVNLLQVPNFEIIKTIDIGHLFVNPSQSKQDYSLISPCVDRLLISYKNVLYLINCKFESLLGSFSDADKVQICQVAEVKGTSFNTSTTSALYLSHDIKNNNTSLKIVAIGVGVNSLCESLGKSIHTPSDEKFKGLPSIFDYSFTQSVSLITRELEEVFARLSKCKSEKDLSTWERICMPYLKDESWRLIKSNLEKPTKLEYSVFDVEKDRCVDSKFVKDIVALLFDGTFEFVPEYTLTYLLTHPLFPQEYSNDLLKLLSGLGQQRLLRQAILTCPTVKLHDLLLQLTHESHEIFEDVVNRLYAKFSLSQVTTELRGILQRDESLIDIDVVLRNLVELDSNASWTLLQAIIDVGGLFHWDMKTIDEVSSMIDDKISHLTKNNYNLTLTNQALLISEPLKQRNKKKRHNKSNKAFDSDIVEVTNDFQKQRLDSVLSISNTSSKKLKDYNIKFPRKIPTYSVEKLLL